MTEKVTSIGLRDVKADMVPNVVDCLESALELAKSGELRSVVVVGDLRGERLYSYCGMEDRVLLLGHLANAIHSVLSASEEDTS